MKRQKDRTLKDELPRLVGAQYATGDQRRNSSIGIPSPPLALFIEMLSKAHIGTWNVRSMNQGKLEVVKQEMARVNIDMLGIRELKWAGMGEFNSDDHYIYYCGQ